MAKNTKIEELESVRIDRWLWAARIFKTRTLAASACSDGWVKGNQKNMKPASKVRIGDTIEVRTPRGKKTLVIASLSTRRGPYVVACTLYKDETEESEPPIKWEDGVLSGPRPSKRERRRIKNLKHRW